MWVEGPRAAPAGPAGLPALARGDAAWDWEDLTLPAAAGGAVDAATYEARVGLLLSVDDEEEEEEQEEEEEEQQEEQDGLRAAEAATLVGLRLRLAEQRDPAESQPPPRHFKPAPLPAAAAAAADSTVLAARGSCWGCNCCCG